MINKKLMIGCAVAAFATVNMPAISSIEPTTFVDNTKKEISLNQYEEIKVDDNENNNEENEKELDGNTKNITLKELVSNFLNLDKEDYKEDSWEEFSRALDNAMIVMNTDNIEEKEIMYNSISLLHSNLERI